MANPNRQANSSGPVQSVGEAPAANAPEVKDTRSEAEKRFAGVIGRMVCVQLTGKAAKASTWEDKTVAYKLCDVKIEVGPEGSGLFVRGFQVQALKRVGVPKLEIYLREPKTGQKFTSKAVFEGADAKTDQLFDQLLREKMIPLALAFHKQNGGATAAAAANTDAVTMDASELGIE